MTTPIRVFLIDDHEVVLEGLGVTLAREPDIEVVGLARDAFGALERIAPAHPDVVVLDHHLPGGDGATLCREIAESGLGAQVVMLSAFADEESVLTALRSGARAYVSKESGLSALAEAVRDVARGEGGVDPRIEPSARSVGHGGSLRYTERQLLRLLADGLTNAEIAVATGLTRETVKSYLRDLYMKLSVRNRAEAVAVAARGGIISGTSTSRREARRNAPR